MEHLVLKLNKSNKIVSSGFNWSQSILYEQGTEGGNVQFCLICQNIPVGTTISFSSDTPGPVPPIYLPPTTVVISSNFVAGAINEVPADHQCTITWSADFKQEPPPGASIYLQAYLTVMD